MKQLFYGEWEQTFVKVVYEGGHEAFFERFLLAVGVRDLLIVSPWVTALSGERIQLSDIVRKITSEGINTRIFMRHPRKEPMNTDTAEIFKYCPTVSLFFNNELHAKVYVCRCDPFGFALVGSANLSGHATRAHEIGIMIDGKGKGQDIIEELQRLGTYDLPGRAGTINAK